MKHILTILTVLFFRLALLAQFAPDSAHVNLYFPQLADGGDQLQSWQTTIVLYNPGLDSATCLLSIYGDDGRPVALDLGSGLLSSQFVLIPPQGRRTLRSRMASRVIVTGWAFGSCDAPIQGTVLFRAINNGVPQVEISAPAVLPSSVYRSIANRSVGIALANIYSSPITIYVAAFDSEGNPVGGRDVTLCPLCHTSFNLSGFPANFPRDFDGTILLSSDRPAAGFAAWTLNSDRGLLSSLPAGGLTWPGTQWFRIWLVYLKLQNAARQIFPGVNLSGVKLEIPFDPVINASATRDIIRINHALAELIADSLSELAFIVAHELAHTIQFRSGRLLINLANRELDADAVGMLLSLAAGYDPYAGAGTLGKLGMVSQRTDIFSQLFDDLIDPHTSFSNRLGEMFSTLKLMCLSPQARDFCSQYRMFIHPSFPPSMPLSIPVGGDKGTQEDVHPIGSRNVR